jgi:hypothetical protein
MAKKKETEEQASDLVRVTATCHINEDGIHHNPGDTFEVSAARAEALGEHVTAAEVADS